MLHIKKRIKSETEKRQAKQAAAAITAKEELKHAKDENVKNNNIYIVNTYKKNGEIKEEREEENIII